MSYSFTEKKRIRKSFATRPSVLEVPSLLETQLRSYEAFLQADVKPESRKNVGLQSAFTSIFHQPQRLRPPEVPELQTRAA